MRYCRLPATHQWSNFNGGCFLNSELPLSRQPVANYRYLGLAVLLNDSVKIMTGLCSTWKPPTSTALSN